VAPVAGQHGEIVGDGGRRDQEVHVGDHLPDLAQTGASTSENLRDRTRDGEDLVPFEEYPNCGDQRLAVGSTMGSVEHFSERNRADSKPVPGQPVERKFRLNDPLEPVDDEVAIDKKGPWSTGSRLPSSCHRRMSALSCSVSTSRQLPAAARIPSIARCGS